jgi:MFS family permease
LALGALLGSLTYGKFCYFISKTKVIFSSFIFDGAGLIVFAELIDYFNNPTVTAIMVLVLGFISAPIMISLYTTLHQRIPDHLRGKIFAAIEMLIHAGFLLFMFLSVLIAKHTDELQVVIMVGIIAIIWGIYGLIRMPIDIEEIS